VNDKTKDNKKMNHMGAHVMRNCMREEVAGFAIRARLRLAHGGLGHNTHNSD
ncbi:unnamed protein product, partial [Sphenostylis stenocarpa]